MKNPHVVAAISAALLVGFFSGRIGSATRGASITTDGGDGETDHGPLKTRVAERSSVGNVSGPKTRLRTEIDKSSSGRMPAMVFRALETGDPVLREQLLASLLGRMDASNFQEMLDEVMRVSNETGREHTSDWILMNVRAGQVAGIAAMQSWKEKGLNSEAALKTFYGWANTDPAAAREWMEQQRDLDPDRMSKFLNALTSGAVVHDPDRAKELFASLPEENRLDCLRDFTSSLVDNVGKDGTVDWLVSLQQTDKDSPYTQKVTMTVFDRLLWSGANRQNAVSMVTDLERLSTVMPIDEGWIVRGMGQIRDRKTTGGIELLDQLAQSPVFKNQQLTDRAWVSAVDFAIKRNPAAVGSWLAANPNSPIHQKVAETYGQTVK